MCCDAFIPNGDDGVVDKLYRGVVLVKDELQQFGWDWSEIMGFQFAMDLTESTIVIIEGTAPNAEHGGHTYVEVVDDCLIVVGRLGVQQSTEPPRLTRTDIPGVPQ